MTNKKVTMRNVFIVLCLIGLVFIVTTQKEKKKITINNKASSVTKETEGCPDVLPEKDSFAMVYGEKHFFKVLTPTDWLLDKKLACENGLTSFFYPSNSQNPYDVYMYAYGFDKQSATDSLTAFVSADIEDQKQKYPNLEVKLINSKIQGNGVVDSGRYQFYHVGKKYGEEVVYIETKDSVLTLTFSASNVKDFERYHPDFNKFVDSFSNMGTFKVINR